MIEKGSQKRIERLVDRISRWDSRRRLVDSAIWAPRGLLVGLLLVTREPELTFEQIRETLGLSKSSTSSALNLLRWVSPRTIKETFVPPTDYRYPFMG